MRRRQGFTLVELLVVLGIILVLIGLLAPMGLRAWRTADRSATAALLNTIAIGLEAYKQDHGDYPRVDGPPYTDGPKGYAGARLLCRALIGPGPGIAKSAGKAGEAEVADGAGQKDASGSEVLRGPGFRTRGVQGKVWGPYLRVEDFKFGDPPPPNRSASPNPPAGNLTLLDKSGSPIAYYPANPKPVSVNTAYAGDYALGGKNPTNAMFNAKDNYDSTADANSSKGPMVKEVFYRMLGDTNANGKIDGTEIAASTAPFLLWSAGPDESFGFDPNTTDLTSPAKINAAVTKCDDVMNFRN